MPLEPDELDRLIGDDPIALDQKSEVPPLCPGCGYNLKGLPETRCPECGRGFSRKQIRRQMSELRRRVSAIEDLVRWPVFGLQVGAFGLACWFLSLLLRSTNIGGVTTVLARVTALLCGLVAIGFGLSILQVFRLPRWVRAQGMIQPNYPAAFGALACGALQVMLAILGI